MELSEIRPQLDVIDNQLLELFLKRMALIDKVADVKKRDPARPLYDPARERDILMRIRENAGLTQMQLAALSGNSLRSIRGYEQGQRSLGKASTESVLSLCRVLGCRTEDLTLHALGTD